MKRKKWRLRCPLPGILRRGTKTPYEPEEDGGARDSTDRDAPKTVKSTLIVCFDCWFSSMDVAEPSEIGGHIYQLWARLENGAVKGTYCVLDTGEKRAFRESHSFMSKVHSLVEKYSLAQYNGICYKVDGLPDDYGVRLNVRYASGEEIYAYNNQDNFLTEEAMEELVKLFARGVQIA